MNQQDFQQLLDSLKVYRKVRPSTTIELDNYEATEQIKLPHSYRAYCQVFGAGEFCDRYFIAVPGYTGKYKDQSDLATKNARVHNNILPLNEITNRAI